MSTEHSTAKPKTIDEFFIDWWEDTFSYGYGSGDEHFLSAIQVFLALCVTEGSSYPSYDYRVLEERMGAQTAWLMINTLCGVDVIEYGTSPRFGWLPPRGMALQSYILSKTTDELIEVLNGADDDSFSQCTRDTCCCGDDQVMRGCPNNPFFND